MRRALGLTDHGHHNESPPDPRSGPAALQRHDPDRRARRFVRDGEVPVVVLNRPRDIPGGAAVPTNRLAVAENALRMERAARERAERALHEAQTNLQHLQTQIGHAALAHKEALEAERQARELLERQLTEALVARDAAQAQLAELRVAVIVEPVRDSLKNGADDLVAEMPVELPVLAGKAPRKVSRVKTSRTKIGAAKPKTDREPQAVKWWLPTFKARSRSG